MRLLAHNMLACNVKGVTKGYPLGLEVVSSVTEEVAFNSNFLRHVLPKLDWKAFVEAAGTLGLRNLPETVEPDMAEDEDFLRRLHHALLEVQVQEGALICPESGRRFPVSKGIPNMMLHEDEV